MTSTSVKALAHEGTMTAGTELDTEKYVKHTTKQTAVVQDYGCLL